MIIQNRFSSDDDVEQMGILPIIAAAASAGSGLFKKYGSKWGSEVGKLFLKKKKPASTAKKESTKITAPTGKKVMDKKALLIGSAAAGVLLVILMASKGKGKRK